MMDRKITYRYYSNPASPAGRWKDLMEDAARIEATVGQFGHVALIDCMPRLVWVDASSPDELNTAEAAVVQAARVSYQKGTKKINEDVGLVRYLMRNRHNTPLEMVETKWHCRMPMFVARQWIRHRTASVNEISARYSELPGEFWIPQSDDLRSQSSKNKQVSEGLVERVSAEQFISHLEEQCNASFDNYQSALKQGIGRELARVGLPLNIYTEWYWKIDLHNLFHFLGLRMDDHAQQEIRDFAEPMFQILQIIAPHAAQAFLDYRLNSIQLSGPEIEALKTGKPTVGTNSRENKEYAAKLSRLGITLSKE